MTKSNGIRTYALAIIGALAGLLISVGAVPPEFKDNLLGVMEILFSLSMTTLWQSFKVEGWKTKAGTLVGVVVGFLNAAGVNPEFMAQVNSFWPVLAGWFGLSLRHAAAKSTIKG